jgi:hypothetical protein
VQITPLSHLKTTPLLNQSNDKKLVFELEMVTITRPSSLDGQMSIRSSFSRQMRVHLKPSEQLTRFLCVVRRSYLKLATHKRSQTDERFPELLTE